MEGLEERRLLAQPSITSAAFDFETFPNKVTFTFDQNVSASLALADVTIFKEGAEAKLTTTNASLSYNSTTNVATYTLPYTVGIYGDYFAQILAADVKNAGNETLTSDFRFDFWNLPGDIDRDRDADNDDLAIMTQNLNTVGTYSDGDFDYSGYVDSDDQYYFNSGQILAPLHPVERLSVWTNGNNRDLGWYVGSKRITGVRVQRSLDRKTWTTLTTLGSTANTYADTTAAGQNYYYRVRGVYVDQYTSNAYTPFRKPGDPTQTSPGAVTIDQIAKNSVRLNWTDTNSSETAYEVWHSLDNTNWTKIKTTAANATNYTFTNLKAARLQYFKVRALGADNVSKFVSTSATTLSGAPAVIGGFLDVSSVPHKFYAEVDQSIVSAPSAGNTSMANLSGYVEFPSSSRTISIGSGSERILATMQGSLGGIVSGALPEGNYEFIVKEDSFAKTGSVTNPDEGVAIGFFLRGDFDGDREITDKDVKVTSDNYGGTNKTYAQGDTDYDGDVDFADLLYIGQHGGVVLAEPPTGPGALVAYTATLDDPSHEMKLDWNAPEEEFDGFKIFRGTDGVNFTEIDDVDAETFTYTDSGLIDDTKYWYRVRGYVDTGSGLEFSSTSNKASGNTILAAPTDAAVAVTNGEQVTVTWQDNSSNETAYVVQANIAGQTDGYVEVANLAANSTSVTFDQWFPHSTTTFRVIAANGATESAFAQTSPVTIVPTPPEMDGISSIGTSALTVNFKNLPGLSNVQLQRKTATSSLWDDISVSPSATSYVDSGRAEGTMYTYRMRASNTAGYGITSQETESYTLTAPPGSLAASLVENTGVDLSWMDASTKETGYLVEMGTSADDLQKLASLPAGTATYKVRGLAPDTTYFFQVSSINTPGARSSATTTATTTSASNWSITGDASLEGTSITQGQTLTLADEEEVAYGDHQDSGLHGGSIKLGSQDRYHFYFEVDYSTWDSYSPIVPWAGHEPATEGGYWDLFSISMTDQSYANTSRTDGNPNAFPMNAPYTRYDTTYRDSVTASNWDEDLVMSFTGSQTASKYLNVMLDTETDPQAGHLHPSYGTVVVKQIPELTIQAIHDQVAEGGETPGKVRITRKTTALTDPLDVSFTRLNADGTTTSHTATIAAGEDSVDVYVAAPAPHVNNPIDVTFTLTPQIDKYVLGAASAPTNAKVTILKQKAILVTFMGLGDGSSLDGGQGDGFGAGLLRETTVSQTTGALGKLDDKFLPANLFVKVYGEREGDLVRREIAEKVNRNIDKFISKAETEAVILNLAGYSYGAVQAANVAFTLGQSQKQFMGYELEVDVPVKNMVMIDAETDWFKVLLGTDYANVEGYKAFYQRKGQMVRVYRRYFDENGAEGPEQLAAAGSWIDQSWMIKGNPMDGLGHVNANKSAINVTDDAAWKNQRRGETFSDRIEYVDGARAQHQSIVYFLKNKNLANPSGQTLVDWLVEDMVP